MGDDRETNQRTWRQVNINFWRTDSKYYKKNPVSVTHIPMEQYWAIYHTHILSPRKKRGNEARKYIWKS